MSYMEHYRRLALEQWRHDDLVWAMTAPHIAERHRKTRPKLPPVLDPKVSTNGDA